MLLLIASAFLYTEIKSGALGKTLSDVVMNFRFLFKWELPGMVLLSLLLQFMLLDLGRRRKKQNKFSPIVAILVWLTSIGADWVATVALSTLLKATENGIKSALVVLWTPFLLLHLGGPHTFSAYSLSDNENWRRYLLGLFIHVGVAIYVYVKFHVARSTLIVMAIPMFVAGIIKYGERILILRAVSIKQIRNDVFSAHPTTPLASSSQTPRGSELVDHLPKLDSVLEQQKVIEEGKDIHRAFFLYEMSLPLFMDLKRRFYRNVVDVCIQPFDSAEHAFKLVGTELEILYDVLFTKTTILQSYIGIILRSICLLCTVSALIAFSITIDKSDYPLSDIAITYLLLVGALFLDIFSVILHLMSKWTMLSLTDPAYKVNSVFRTTTISWMTRCSVKKQESLHIAQHNIIDYCLKTGTSRFRRLMKALEVEDIFCKLFWTRRVQVNFDLKEFIYSTLQNKLDKYKKGEYKYTELAILLYNRGISVLESHQSKWQMPLEEFHNSIKDVQFSHSLLVWHIATHLLYHDDHMRFSGSVLGPYCQISKQLSDYMMYLQLLHPLMLPKGIGEERIGETRDELIRFFNGQGLPSQNHITAALFDIDHDIGLLDIAENQTRHNSEMLEGCQLGIRLRAMLRESRLDHEEKWEMIANVWVEMLIFAADKCFWNEHKMELRHGGELLTHVALLMAHLGLTKRIQIVEAQRFLGQANPPHWYHLIYYLKRCLA